MLHSSACGASDKIEHGIVSLWAAGTYCTCMPLETGWGPDAASGPAHPLGQQQPGLRHEQTAPGAVQQFRTVALGPVPLPPTTKGPPNRPRSTVTIHSSWPAADRLGSRTAPAPAAPGWPDLLCLKRSSPPPPSPRTPPPPPAQVAFTVAEAWDAYRARLRADLRDHHSDTLAFAVRALAKGTGATYLCAVRGRVQGTNNNNDVQLAIDSRLLLPGQRRGGGSVARNTISWFQMLAKLHLIPEVVTARMWLQVRAIDKTTGNRQSLRATW